MRKEITCDTPYCSNTFTINTNRLPRREYLFCNECKKEHSYYALVVQVEHEKPIKEVILESKIFNSASGMSAYIGVSFVTMYHWIKKYFDLTYQQFRRAHICNSNKCYLLNISRSSYSRHDYVLKKIRDKRYCACINALEPDHIMTNAPVSVVSSIFKDNPVIEKISDNLFAVMPIPIYFQLDIYPLYFDLHACADN